MLAQAVICGFAAMSSKFEKGREALLTYTHGDSANCCCQLDRAVSPRSPHQVESWGPTRYNPTRRSSHPGDLTILNRTNTLAVTHIHDDAWEAVSRPYICSVMAPGPGLVSCPRTIIEMHTPRIVACRFATGSGSPKLAVLKTNWSDMVKSGGAVVWVREEAGLQARRSVREVDRRRKGTGEVINANGNVHG